MTSLAEPYADRYDDPLARIDWTGVAHDCWWLPPSALSLAGVPAFEALPLATRRRLSHLEYVHLLETGLWLESLFIARLAQLAHASRDVAERAARLRGDPTDELVRRTTDNARRCFGARLESSL